MSLGAVIAQGISARLVDAIGMDAGALDPRRLQWIVESRCRALRLPDASAYAGHLEATPDELDALIDEVVVPETRFFRDAAVFSHLGEFLPKLAAAFPGPLRILSAPCGTGQEAWSLAAALVLAGIPLGRFSIDAFDISVAALTAARNARYPEAALGGVSAERQRACATLRRDVWTINREVVERVNFVRRNLAEPDTLAAGITSGRYHLILCRNLFIYLHPQARATLAQSLAEALIPGGRLILGTADRVEEVSALFAPVRPAASFAFTRRESNAVAAVPPALLSSRSEAKGPAFLSTSTPAPRHAPALSTHVTPHTFLQHALEHHRKGDLRKAERLCRQALYLSPDLLPALELLQTLWIAHPNLRLSRAIKARIQRSVDADTRLAAWEESA